MCGTCGCSVNCLSVLCGRISIKVLSGCVNLRACVFHGGVGWWGGMAMWKRLCQGFVWGVVGCTLGGVGCIISLGGVALLYRLLWWCSWLHMGQCGLWGGCGSPCVVGCVCCVGVFVGLVGCRFVFSGGISDAVVCVCAVVGVTLGGFTCYSPGMCCVFVWSDGCISGGLGWCAAGWWGGVGCFFAGGGLSFLFKWVFHSCGGVGFGVRLLVWCV